MKKKLFCLFLVVFFAFSAITPVLAHDDMLLLDGATIYFDYVEKDDGTTGLKVAGCSTIFNSVSEIEAWYYGTFVPNQETAAQNTASKFDFVATNTGLYIQGVGSNTGTYDNINSTALSVARWAVAMLTLTSLALFIYAITQIAVSSGAANKRQKAIRTLMYSGASLALFGSLTAVIGFFWGFL